MPRNTLSRSAIVEAALELIDDKRDLIDAVAEQVMGQIEVPDGAADDWEGRVVGSLRALRETATAHPALGRILADHGLTVGPVFVQLETVHGILVRAGFAANEAVRAFYSLFTYVFGAVMWELPRVHQQPADAYVSSWNSAIDALNQATTRICTRCVQA